MKIIFMGSQEFSAKFLQEFIHQKYDIAAVFTREPKPAGKNKKLTKTPVHILAEQNNLRIETPKSLRNFDISSLGDFDLIIVVGYGLILPKSFVDHQCINVHPSILPRWRGAAPIERALWNGDKKTAATIMLMDEGLDTGDILSFEEIAINERDNFISLSEKLAESATKQLFAVINNLDYYLANKTKQTEEGLIYAEKLSNEEKKFNFNDAIISVVDLNNRIKALQHGLMIKLKNLNEEFKIFDSNYELCQINENEIGNGFIQNKQFHIVCKDGYLLPKVVKKTNGSGRLLDIKDFVNGLNLN